MTKSDKALIIHNPASGQQPDIGLVQVLGTVLSEAGYASALRQTTGARDAKDWAATAQQQGFDLIVVAGGDGTVMQAISGVIQSATTLDIAIAPLGTGNLLSRAIGLPADPIEALQASLAGYRLAFDVGYLVDRKQHFMLSAGIGFDADVIRQANRGMKDRLGFFAYIWASLTNLFNRRSRTLTLTTDGQTRRIRAHTVMVFNAPPLKLGALELGPGVNPHDGTLDIAIMHDSSSLGTIASMARLLTGRLKKEGQPEYLRASSVKLAARRPLVVQADGEVLSKGMLAARILPAAVQLLVPAGYQPKHTEEAL